MKSRCEIFIKTTQCTYISFTNVFSTLNILFHIIDITPPLVVLNNFGQSEESQVKLMRITFQHMFPTINTKTVKLSDCRRVVLYHYHKEEGTVEMRHYAIKAQPTGVSSAVKRILQSRIPNLGDLEVSRFYMQSIFSRIT